MNFKSNSRIVRYFYFLSFLPFFLSLFFFFQRLLMIRVSYLRNSLQRQFHTFNSTNFDERTCPSFLFEIEKDIETKKKYLQITSINLQSYVAVRT